MTGLETRFTWRLRRSWTEPRGVAESNRGRIAPAGHAALRVAVGRNAWLFVGSDDHGQAAGNLLTLIASARLHKLDPEVYLRDIFRVLPFWPRDRYLEHALGPIRVMSNFFILERHRRGFTNYATR